MFSKKTCSKCKKKINKDYDYCPHCGSNSKEKYEDDRDYGFLGKNDLPKTNDDFKLPFGFKFLFKNLMKEMDKQFKQLDKEAIQEKMQNKREIKENKIPFTQGGGLSINISGATGKPIIKVKGFGNIPELQNLENHMKPKKENTKKIRKTKRKEFSEEKIKKLSKLPREEAESKVRRLSGKVIYEIDLPGVKKEDDVVINELENSIEVKAFSKDKAYFKFLPISLPLLKYKLLKEKLVLELGEDKKQF